MASYSVDRLRNYAYEACGYCQGKGVDAMNLPCLPCRANGRVLVYQPPIECPRCKGNGKSLESETHYFPFCPICRGAGWLVTLMEKPRV